MQKVAALRLLDRGTPPAATFHNETTWRWTHSLASRQ